jgi:hypothetical protein
MTDFSNEQDVRRWASRQTPGASVVFAARAALRVVPALALDPSLNTRPIEEAKRNDILAVFRAVAASWVVGAYPAHGKALRPFVAPCAIGAADATLVSQQVSRVAAAAAGIASDAYAKTKVTQATRVRRSLDRAVAGVALLAGDAAAGAGKKAWGSVIKALSIDAQILNQEVSPIILAANRLWPEPPEWARENWAVVRQGLLDADEGWETWTDWYEARLRGGTANQALEVARVKIDEGIWQQGPKVVNFEIKQLIEEPLIFAHVTDEKLDRDRENSPPRFSDRRGFEQWLSHKPDQWSRVLAARSALRAVPVLAAIFESRDVRLEIAERTIILPIFRALAAAWTSARYADSDSVLAAKVSREDIIGSDTIWDASALVAGAATSAALAVGANNAERAAYAAGEAAVSITAYAASADRFWAVTGDDARILEHGIAPYDLASHPLWPGEIPDWARAGWRVLWHALLSANPDWEVWTNWYTARVSGGPIAEETNFAFAVIPEEIWEQGPRAVNARIKAFIEGYTSKRRRELVKDQQSEREASDSELLSQRPAAHTFLLREGRIEAEPQRGAPSDENIAQDIYEQVKAKAADLAEKLYQTNSDHRTIETAQRLLDCLGSILADVKPGILLMRYRALEADAASYDTAEARRELFPDAISRMRDLTASVDDLLGLYSAIRKVQAASLALEVQRADVSAIQVYLAEIRQAAASSDSVAVSAQAALEAALPEVEHATRSVERARGDVARATAVERRAEIVSIQILDYRNFVSATVQPLAKGLRRVGAELKEVAGKSYKEAKDAIPRAVGQSVEGAVKAGIATLIGALSHPLIGLAALVASLRPLARKIDEAKKATENEQAQPPGKADNIVDGKSVDI